MPFVRISLPGYVARESRDQISQSVHQSLIRAFNIPEDDYFHIIEELNTEQIKFPGTYLGIEHTADIVYIQIIAGKGRNTEQKRRLYQEIADRIANTTSITKNNIIIVLLENNGKQDWSFGNGEIQDPKHLNQ